MFKKFRKIIERYEEQKREEELAAIAEMEKELERLRRELKEREDQKND